MKKNLLLVVFLFFLLASGTFGHAGQPANGPVRTSVDPGMDYVPGEILVRFSSEVGSEQANSLGVDYGLSVQECIATINLCRMKIQDGKSELEAASRVSSDSRTLYAEPNFIDHVSGYPAGDVSTTGDMPQRIPNDSMYGQQWHYSLINMPAAWNITTGKSSLVIGVVDTGVRFDHPDLKSRLSTHGYDFIGNDKNPTDPDNGHGTHTSGTIGAVTNNTNGVAGMTWSGVILPVRTLGTGGGSVFQFSQGIRYAAGLLSAPDPVNPTPAKVINYSGGGGDSTTKKEAVAAVNAAKVLMVCSSGNNNGAVIYPAAYSLEYPYVICVGATNYGNGFPTRAYYSNFGPEMNVVAPGGDTTVDSDGDGNPDGVLSTTWNFSTNKPVYEFWMGTSMAAPHVTGLVSLMLARGCPRGLIRTALQETATDLGPAGFDNEYGWGLINAEAALKYPCAYVTLLSPNGSQLISSGSGYEINWQAAPEATAFKLSYSLNNGVTWAPIGTGTVTGTSTVWDVPILKTNKTKCLVKITAYDDKNAIGTDKSDNPFTVEVLTINSPASSDTCTSGQPCAIAWSKAPNVDAHTGKLFYSMDGGLTWKMITDAVTGSDTTYSWTPITGKTKKNSKVKLIYKNDKGKTVATAISGKFNINKP